MHITAHTILAYIVILFASSAAIASDFQIGYEAALKGDYTTALRVWTPLAESGNAQAQVYLGIMHSNGIAGSMINFSSSVPQDLGEAEKWFRQAADQHVAEAKMYLGELHLFTESYNMAQLGDAVAQSKLGVILATGYVLCSWCRFRIIPQNYSEAIAWMRKSSDQGNAIAQFNLATLYHQGKGVAKDILEAEKLYREASEAGHPGAQMNLALMYANGLGVEKNDHQMSKWFHLSARQGYINSWLLLAAKQYLGMVPFHPYILTLVRTEIIPLPSYE